LTFQHSSLYMLSFVVPRSFSFSFVPLFLHYPIPCLLPFFGTLSPSPPQYGQMTTPLHINMSRDLTAPYASHTYADVPLPCAYVQLIVYHGSSSHLSSPVPTSQCLTLRDPASSKFDARLPAPPSWLFLQALCSILLLDSDVPFVILLTFCFGDPSPFLYLYASFLLHKTPPIPHVSSFLSFFFLFRLGPHPMIPPRSPGLPLFPASHLRTTALHPFIL